MSGREMAKRNQSLNKTNFIKISLLYVVALSHRFGIGAVVESECGIVAPSAERIRFIDLKITGHADEINKGDWPFLVALRLAKTLEFFCGGTIISSKHVLTAAHCIQAKRSQSKLLPADVLVFLGKHDLNVTNERDVVQQSPTKIHVHAEWNVYSDQYDADIAILVLSDNIEFTAYIRSVCLPADDVVIDGNNIDVPGSVVGWGLTENGSIANIPRVAATNGLTALYCLTNNPNIAFLSSMRTFCGGGGKATPNRGDSGGGFFVKSGTAWTQYGVISVMHTLTAHKFAVYTNVKMFKNWIVAISEESIEAINLSCRYSLINLGYACHVLDLNIRNKNVELGSVTGSHRLGKTDQDVEFIQLKNGTMSHLPDGIGKFFKNLKIFYVGGDESTNLNTNHISRSSLKHFENLVEIRFLKNEIEIIDEDSLWDLPNLETFEVRENRLKVLKERTFERNLKLREVYINTNQLETLPRNLFRNNLLLEDVYFRDNNIKTIGIDFTGFRKIKIIDFYENPCIDAFYSVGVPEIYKNQITNFIEFLNLIKANCTSVPLYRCISVPKKI